MYIFVLFIHVFFLSLENLYMAHQPSANLLPPGSLICLRTSFASNLLDRDGAGTQESVIYGFGSARHGQVGILGSGHLD